MRTLSSIIVGMAKSKGTRRAAQQKRARNGNNNERKPRRNRRGGRPRQRVAAPMNPSMCRALALSSPCDFKAAVDAGKAVLLHARDPSSAGNSTVQIIEGVAQFQADLNGDAAVILYPSLVDGIVQLGANAAADQWSNLPGALAASGSAAWYRVISMAIRYTCMASYMGNAGSLYCAALDPSLGQVDPRNEAGIALAARVKHLRDIIDDRPKGSYSAGAAKDQTQAVIARTGFTAVVLPTIGGAYPNLVSSIGDAFRPGLTSARGIWFPVTLPPAAGGAAANIRYADVNPCAALAISGAAASMPFQIEVCAVVEVIPATTIMGVVPGGAAGTGGALGALSKLAHLDSVQSAERLEEGAERVAESGLRIAGDLGVPGVGAAATALHAGQAGVRALEHSRVGRYLGL